MQTRVTFTLDGSLGRLTLIGVQRRNAIDQAFVDELAEAVDAAHAAEGMRALLVSADGPSFSVGGDLTYLAERADGLSATLDTLITTYHRGLDGLGSIPVPVVCAVQGAAAGGALGIVWPADVVVVAEDLKLVTGFDKLGLSGDGNCTWWLPRLVGMRRAQELLVGGRALDAAEAVDWGIATRCVPLAELLPVAERYATKLAAGPTTSLSRQRALIRRSFDVSLESSLQAEHDGMRETALTADAVRGVRAFAARERPVFDGR